MMRSNYTLQECTCKFCDNPAKIGSGIKFVVPYYKYSAYSDHNPAALQTTNQLDITEEFMCPDCGQMNKNRYYVDLDQEMLQDIMAKEKMKRG